MIEWTLIVLALYGAIQLIENIVKWWKKDTEWQQATGRMRR